MVRTERYKYCVFSRGTQRESLVDLRVDPGEMIDLATDPKHREVLLQHRELLARFGRERHDALATELLADNVKARPFEQPAQTSPKAAGKNRRGRASVTQPTEPQPGQRETDAPGAEAGLPTRINGIRFLPRRSTLRARSVR